MNTKTLARVTGAFAVALFLASSYAVLRAQVPQLTCGNEGEPPCGITLTNAGVRHGLAAEPAENLRLPAARIFRQLPDSETLLVVRQLHAQAS